MKDSLLSLEKKGIIIHVFSILTILFVYSGMIKLIAIKFIPIDLTLGLFALFLFVFLIHSFYNKIQISVPFNNFMFIITIFITIMISSLFYTISENYSVKKIVFFILLNTGSFIILYHFTVNNLINFKDIQLFLFITSFLIGILFIYLKISGKIYFYLYHNPNKPTLFPDYLSTASFIAVSLIANLNKNSLIYYFHRLLLFSTILILSARGPFIFLIFIVFFYAIVKYSKKQLQISALAIIIFTIILLNTNIANIMINRLSQLSLFNNSNSITSRIRLINKAKEIIIKKPILGIGIGGYGKYLSGKDSRTYPHNTFLEIMSEIGIFAGLLWIIFFLYVFLILYKNKPMTNQTFTAYLICLFLFLESLKSSGLLDLRILFFWFGIYIGLLNNQYSTEIKNKNTS